MKTFRIVLLATPLALAAAPGLAADVTYEEPVAPLPMVEDGPTYIWSGPYAGAFAGYSASDFDEGANFDGEGAVGGIYGGYNFQNDLFVYGVEADVGFSGVDAGGTSETGDPLAADSGAFGSLRGRLGVAYDPIMVFATGGIAADNKELSYQGAEDSNTHIGYTVGAGVEAKVTDSIESRIEYRYSDFSEESYDFGDVSVSTGFDEHSIRAGLALKF